MSLFLGHVLLTRRYRFRALHQLAEESVAGEPWILHGHDYALEVTVKGALCPKAGWLMARDELDAGVYSLVLSELDKKHLNKIFFHTSGESLVGEIFKKLIPWLGQRLHRVALQETKKNRFYTILNENRSLPQIALRKKVEEN